MGFTPKEPDLAGKKLAIDMVIDMYTEQELQKIEEECKYKERQYLQQKEKEKV